MSNNFKFSTLFTKKKKHMQTVFVSFNAIVKLYLLIIYINTVDIIYLLNYLHTNILYCQQHKQSI